VPLPPEALGDENPGFLEVHGVNRYIFCNGDKNHRGANLRKIAAALVALLLAGCGGGGGVVQETADGAGKKAGESSRNRDIALQHFIDGSVFEMKGDHARAVLEFQDALRYDRDPAILYALSKNYALLGKHALAIETGREAVRLAPDNLDCRRTLAEAYAAAFDLESAATQYEEVIKRDSGAADAWYALARLVQPRSPLRALEVYRSITRRFGADWNVLLQTTELSSKLGRFEEAADALRRMSELDPGNIPLMANLAQSLVRAGKNEEALAVFADIEDREPGNIAVRSEIAGLHLALGHSDEARSRFTALLAVDSLTIEQRLNIGEILFRHSEKDSTILPFAQMVFTTIRDAHRDDWRPYWFLGAIGGITNDDSLAVQSFRRMTELANWNADGWVYLSGVFLGNNDFATTASILEAAQRYLPDDFRVNFFLGVAYHRLGRSRESVEVLENARRINPKDVDALAQLALVYDELKEHTTSDSLYEEALRLDPKSHLVLNNYAYSLAERNLRLDRALQMATGAVEAQPRNASYLDTIGWVYYRLGRYREAESYVRKALESGEPSSAVLEHLGDIYFRLDEPERAREYWAEALKLDQDNMTLKEKLARGTL
jgi:tetratricopeptide (TPR) repeat protein